MSDPAHNILAANWDPEILAAYMAKTQQGNESDEAMSSDESDSDVEFEEGNPSLSSETTMSDIEISRPDDIASDDSAFSSEDEFASDDVTQKQTVHRELVLGRPAPALLQIRIGELYAMQRAYMKQLDDADEELAEITGTTYQAVARRAPVSGLDKPIVRGDDLEAYILELRKRSDKEVASADSRKVLIQELVVLAQAVFRKERQIKHLQG